MTDYGNKAWGSVPLTAAPEDKISTHFQLRELTRSEIANRLNIDNQFPSEKELHAAVYLCREVLESLRTAFGSFSPNSVYRGQNLERALKGKPWSWVSTSQHTLGCACDVEIAGKPTLELAHWAQKNLKQFDQIICECYNPQQGPNSGWVHISLRPPGYGANRKQLLSYVFDPASRRYVYVPGLTASVA